MADEPVVPVEEEVEEVEEEEVPEGSDTTDDDIPEADLKEAKNLYRLLKDPATSNVVIKALAEKAGVLQATTPTEVKAAKKELKDIISEALGPQYAFMVGPMERVFEKVLAEERAERSVETQALSQKQVDQEVDSSLSRLARETNGNSRKLEGKMVALMDQLHASPTISTYDYLKLLYETANSGKSAAGARQQIADKINRNSKDAPGRLQGSTTGKVSQQPAVPEKRGIRAAVEFAVKQLEKG